MKRKQKNTEKPRVERAKKNQITAEYKQISIAVVVAISKIKFFFTFASIVIINLFINHSIYIHRLFVYKQILNFNFLTEPLEKRK